MKVKYWFAILAIVLSSVAHADEPRGLEEYFPPAPVDRGIGQYKVLLVGDSWAYFMWSARSLRGEFADNGYSQYWEKGDVTAIAGSEASGWVAPARLQLITDELADYPNIEVVHLFLGGNDMLNGAPDGWYEGITQEDELALFERVAGDVETVVNHALSQRPNVRVLIGSYDYPNFVESLNVPFSPCPGTHDDLNNPSPREMNEALLRFEPYMQAIADKSSRVNYISMYGLMHNKFGYPSMNINPGELDLPGDLSLPSPPQAMFLNADCIHLNADGYGYVAEKAWNEYYQGIFEGSNELVGDAFVLY